MLYRGQDMGGRTQLARYCVEKLQRGDPEDVYDLLPHIRILRSPLFRAPLLKLLREGSNDQKAAAATALGGIGDSGSLPWLMKSLEEGPDPTSRLFKALVSALGESGSDEAAGALGHCFQSLNPNPRHARRSVLVALGLLTQQKSKQALQELTRVLNEGSPIDQIQVLGEFSVAFWQDPDALPETLLERIVELSRSRNASVKEASTNCLASLADLGSEAVKKQLAEFTARPE